MTITEKLELLTVPDMVDAIWARIETQLDIDMPPDEGPADPPSTPPAGAGSWTRVVITIFVAAFVTAIFLTNRKTNTNNNNQLNTPVNTTTISSPDNSNDKPPPAGSPVIPSQQQVTQDKNAPLPLPPNQDSLNTIGDGAGRAIPDSVVVNPVLVPAPVISSVDTSKKKSRGVQGIQDADYRITPVKKDSTD